MQVYFIRHAQSQNNALYERTGSWDGRSIDPDLTEIGLQQARLVAEFLSRNISPISMDRLENDPRNASGFGITHVYTSLMIRSISTGVVIADALGLPLVASANIYETGGIYLRDPETGEEVGQPGPNKEELQARFPSLCLPEYLGELGWWNRPFESREQRAPRAERVLKDLLKIHAGTQDRIALISHGGFYNYFLAALQKTQRGEGYWFLMNNTAISRFDFTEEGITIVYHNRTEHLPNELIT